MSPTFGPLAATITLNIFKRLYLYDYIIYIRATKMSKEDNIVSLEKNRGTKVDVTGIG